MKKNVASQVIGAQLVDKDTGTAYTGSATVYVTGDGGTQGSGGGTGPTHEGQGFYTYLPTQAETNYTHVAFTFTATSAVPVTVQAYTNWPQTGDAYPDTQSISARAVTIYADTQSISANAVTALARLPTTLVGGRIDANIGSISGDTTSVARMEFALNTEVLGTVTTGATVSTIPVTSFSPTPTVNDQFVGRVIIFRGNTTTAALRGQASIITDSTTSAVTVTDLTTAPASGDTFVIV